VGSGDPPRLQHELRVPGPPRCSSCSTSTPSKPRGAQPERSNRAGHRVEDFVDEFVIGARILAPAGTVRIRTTTCRRLRPRETPITARADARARDAAGCCLLCSATCEVDRLCAIAGISSAHAESWSGAGGVSGSTRTSLRYQFARDEVRATSTRRQASPRLQHLHRVLQRSTSRGTRLAFSATSACAEPVSMDSRRVRVYLDGAWHPIDAATTADRPRVMARLTPWTSR